MLPFEDVAAELDRLETWGYRVEGPAFAEPTAFAAMVLAAHGRTEGAKRACDWLKSLQAPDGSVGVCHGEAIPGWPTAHAILAWKNFDATAYAGSIENGLGWLLATKGKQAIPAESNVGHDVTLQGWPWVIGTHSWYEPTAFAFLALRATGNRDDERAKVAVRLLIDRLLPNGGCNYGNTFVLHNTLRPHIEPSGIALMALAGVPDKSGRLEKTVAYVQRELSAETASLSMAYGLMGLTAQGVDVPDARAWLEQAVARTREQGASPLKMSLLALAGLGADCPILRMTKTPQAEPAKT